MFSKKGTETPEVQGYVDEPAEGRSHDALTLRIEGWVKSNRADARVTKVNIFAEGKLVGSTAYLFPRPDVSASYGLSPKEKTGFRAFLSLPQFCGKTVALTFVAELGASRSSQFTSRSVTLTAGEMLKGPFGHLVDPSRSKILRKADVYGSGPPLEMGSPELLSLLLNYVDPPPCKIVDVGCGLGFYGQHLIQAGYSWLGVEQDPNNIRRLSEKRLPFLHADGNALPFENRQFDHAICLEVLEHIDTAPTFVAELARVTKRGAIISVPNVELIPYLNPYAAVPWHMLADDHTNFFTRASLRAVLEEQFSHVEVVMYGACPLKSAAGDPLYYNLLAIARH